MTKQYISLAMLAEAGACHSQRDQFLKVFGRRIELTKNHCIVATRLGFDLCWFAEQFFHPHNYKRFHECENYKRHQVRNEYAYVPVHSYPTYHEPIGKLFYEICVEEEIGVEKCFA